MTTGRYDIQAEHRQREARAQAAAEHQSLSDSVDELRTTVTQLQTTMKIGVAIVVAALGFVVSGAVWTMRTALESQERLTALTATVERHTGPGEGHASTIAAVADVRAEQRALDAGVRSELAGINRRLDDIAAALAADREAHRRR